MSVRSRWGLALLLAAAALASCRRAQARVRADASAGGLVARRTVEDVFLLTGELRSTRSVSIVAPRSDRNLQIRWLAEDGADVAEGDRVVELDSGNELQSIEERRLRLRQAEIERDSRERAAEADAERKRVAVEKAEIEAEKARIDAAVPRELRAGAEWSKLQAAWLEKQAELAKARLEEQAFQTTTRADLEVLRRSEEKARREVEQGEKALASMSLRAPTGGMFLVGSHPQWNPEGPRKLQPGDGIWSGYPLASIPDPTAMEVGATLSEVDDGRIAPGMPARCILDTYPDRVFEGRVEEVGAVAAEPRRSFGPSTARTGFPVRVSLQRTDPLMRPGLSVRVEVVRKVWPAALALPRAAVGFDKDGAWIRARGGARGQRVAIAGCTAVDCVLEPGAVGDSVD
jgi:multidrug resistance efflux pump